MPFSSGNPDFLIAPGTFVDVIVLQLRHIAAEILEKGSKSALKAEKLLILFIPLRDISGKDPEIEDDQQHKLDQMKEGRPNKGVDDNDADQNP